MKIVITGSESFIGKELVSQSEKQGIDVVGLDSAKSTRGDFIKADIRSRDIVNLVPESTDAIVHLAALSRDSDCRNNAYECFNVNVLGTLNLINAAVAKHVKQFIFASSEWVYNSFIGDKEKDEDSPIDIGKLTSEYALSKLVSEINLRQKYQHGFCPATILRFGIVYGPRKTPMSAVESLFYSVQSGNEIKVGSLQTARRFVHVADIASGIIKSMGLPGFNVINLQGDRLVSLGDIIEAAARLLNCCPRIIEQSPESKNIRNISNRKAKKLLQWQPGIDLDAGLKSLFHD